MTSILLSIRGEGSCRSPEGFIKLVPYYILSTHFKEHTLNNGGDSPSGKSTMFDVLGVTAAALHTQIQIKLYLCMTLLAEDMLFIEGQILFHKS